MVKGKRTDLGMADCAVARSLQIIGDWWSLLIVRQSFLGCQRFGEFQKSLGLAKNILSARLKKLVEAGVFRIEPDDVQPKRHRYVLTQKGERLQVILIALWQWGEEACFEHEELPWAWVDRQQHLPLARLELRADDGRSIGPGEFELVPKVSPPVA